MKRNDITVEGVRDWLRDEEVLYASSTRERKRLYCNLDGDMNIRVGYKVVWVGRNISAAVEAYNAITETYKDDLKEFKI